MGKYLTLQEENKTEEIKIAAKNGNPKVEEKVGSVYTMLSKDNQEYRFNLGGQLVYMKEPNGSFVLLKYDAKTGRLILAVTNQNLRIRFQYADNAKEQIDELVQGAAGGDTGGTKPRDPVTAVQPPSRQDTAHVLNMPQIAATPVKSGTYANSTVAEAAENLSLVRGMILPDGSRISYEYDKKNHLLCAARQSGEDKVSYRYTYDKDGKLSTVYDALGNPYQLTYESGRVKTAAYPETEGGQRTIQFTYRDIREEDSVYETLIQQGVDGVYGTGELVKSSRNGNMLYNRDEKGAESTYTYEDNMLKTTTLKSEYLELEQDTVIAKEGVRTTDTTYDEAVGSNPVSEVDEEGNEVTYEYAEQENIYADDLPTSMTEVEDGIVTGDYTYTYDAYGNELEETDSVTGDSVETSYYGADSEFSGEVRQEVEKTRAVSENGQAAYKVTTRDYQYSYDGASGTLTETVTEMTDGNAVTTVDKYDKMGNLIYHDDGLGTTIGYTYDFLGRLTGTEYNEGGILATTESSYDSNGTLIQETAKDGTVTKYTYDAENKLTGRVVSKDGMSRSYRTAYAWEWHGDGETKERMQTVTNTSPGNQVTVSSYNVLGWNTKNIAAGLCMETEYNRHGEAVEQRTGAADGSGKQQVLLTLYDNAGNPAMTIQNPGFQDGHWKVAADSITQSSSYDKRGNKLSETDGEGHRTEFAYDELSRLVKVSLEDGTGQPNVTLYGYDIYENDGTVSTRTTDALGNISKDYVDGEGRTVKTADLGDGTVSGLATAYQYDRKGNNIRETYSNGAYKTYEYDGRNRLTKVSYFRADGTGTLVTKYTYSASDQVLSMDDFEVDAGAEKRYRHTAYEYDEFGQLTGFIESDEEQALTEGQKDERRTSFAYDEDGKLIEIRYPQAENHVSSLEYRYDENGWLESIYAGMDSGEKNLLRAYLYTADGKVSEIRDYRGFVSGDTQSYIRKVYAYDTLNRVTGMEYSDSISPEQVTESYGYTYDKNSNILIERISQTHFASEEEQIRESRVHAYDALGRLASTEIWGLDGILKSKTTYTYDKNGNRLTETTGSETTRNTYNSLNQMLTAKKTEGATVLSDRSYVYDANGNLKSEADSILEKSTEYAYDVGNRMVQAVRKGKGDAVLTQTNRYNGSGQRIQKTEDGKTTNYYYQGTAVRATTDAEGNKSSFNLYGLEGNVIASGRYTGSCAGEYLTSGKDLKGSITSLIKPDGSCAAVYRYTDFGETVMYAAEDVENEICYTGGIYDESTGLYYLNARYYDPQDGRFTSQDTYRGKDEEYKTWNLYTYCANNPVGYVDPSGHEFVATTVTLYFVFGLSVTIAYTLWETIKGLYYCGREIVNVVINYTYRAAESSSYSAYKSQNAAKAQARVKRMAKTKTKVKMRNRAIETAIQLSKGGKQNVKDSRFAGVENEELLEMKKDLEKKIKRTRDPKKKKDLNELKEAIKKHLKSKREINKQSKTSNYTHSK